MIIYVMNEKHHVNDSVKSLLEPIDSLMIEHSSSKKFGFLIKKDPQCKRNHLLFVLISILLSY